MVEHARRRHERGHSGDAPGCVSERIDRVARLELIGRRVVAAGQHAPPETGTLGEQVHPCHRVPEVAVPVVHQRHEGVEVGRPRRVDRAAAGLDAQQSDRRLEDDAGQTHPAHGRPEQVRPYVRRELGCRPVGEQQRQPPHVVAERAVDVMVLAVDVAGDRPADGHVSGSGGNRHEVPTRHEDGEQVVEADPGGDRGRRDDVVDDDVLHPVGEADHHSAAVLRRVAVGPPETPGDAAARREVLDDRRQPFDVTARPDDQLGEGRGRAAPARQHRRGSVSRHRGESLRDRTPPQ